MKIKIGSGYQTFSCTIAPASGITVSIPEDEDLDSDTVVYAVCRLFCQSPKLAQPYVWESYQLRLATGKERKVQRHRITIPAALAELPGGWINVKFSVAPTGIQVDRVEFLGAAGSPLYGEGDSAADSAAASPEGPAAFTAPEDVEPEDVEPEDTEPEDVEPEDVEPEGMMEAGPAEAEADPADGGEAAPAPADGTPAE